MAPLSEPIQQRQQQQQQAQLKSRSPPTQASTHFAAGRLLSGSQRPERASWSPQAMDRQRNIDQASIGAYQSGVCKKAAEQVLLAAATNENTSRQKDPERQAQPKGRWQMLSAKRESSREQSMSPSSSDLDEENDENDEGDENDDNCDNNNDDNQDPSKLASADGALPGASSAAAKPHVGPMGIFFKVWSLVKVTKARHNKMKRLHSEDAGQPRHYSMLPGGDDQQQQQPHLTNGTLATASLSPSPASSSGSPMSNHHLQPTTAISAFSQQQRQPQQQAFHTRSTHILQDGHFRRAGSQPPLTTNFHLSSSDRLQQATMIAPMASADSNYIKNHSDTSATHASLQTSANNGTNGSSSGVSSTTSSTLATNHSHCAGVTTSEQVAALNLAQQSTRQAPPTTTSKMTTSKSWASRMRKSPVESAEQQQQQQQQQRAQTGVTGSTSYASRYRFRRADANQRQVGTPRAQQMADKNGVPTSRQSAPSALKQAPGELGQVRAQSEAESELLPGGGGGLKPKLSRVLRLRGSRQPQRDSISDEDTQDDTTKSGDLVLQLQKRASEEDNDDSEDSDDLNDIYSTPNDSIQSVPSGGGGGGAHAPPLLSNSKSGSGQQLATQVAPTAVNSRAPSQRASLTGNNGSTHYQMTKSFSTNNFNSHLSKQQTTQVAEQIQQLKKQQQQQQRTNAISQGPATRTRGSNCSSSRFFISSSSSEDSSAPQQQQQQQQQQPIVHATPASTERLPLSVGLHYHSPARRPNSLLIEQRAPLQQQHPGSSALLTPSAIMMGAIEPSASIAAMSPMLVNPTTNYQHDTFVIQSNRPTRNCQLLGSSANYKKSPSLFEMSHSAAAPALAAFDHRTSSNLVAKFSSKYPWGQPALLQQHQQAQSQMTSFVGKRAQFPPIEYAVEQRDSEQRTTGARQFICVPHSISLHDCKLASANLGTTAIPLNEQEAREDDKPINGANDRQLDMKKSEYKLAQMLLELGNKSNGGGGGARDERGYTALMHAIISENLSAIKCLIEHGVDLNETNNEGLSALDLVCCKQTRPSTSSGSSESRGQSHQSIAMEMMKLLIEHRVDLDKPRESDGSRLLDRLIGEHDAESPRGNKLAFIDCLLHNGAKLGSATWAAATGKEEIQLRLLRKLCQDGYFLYKKSCIEAAVYRFEYALKRIESLEQQLDEKDRMRFSTNNKKKRARVPLAELADNQLQVDEWRQQQQQVTGATAPNSSSSSTRAAVQQIKYQTFLGLSRCERKRRFFKRALEFAHMSILVDSTSYEGYYSKAHILKDLGQLDDALLSIDQTERLVLRSIELIQTELCDLRAQQEEAIVFDGAFQVHDPSKSRWLEASCAELNNTLDYLMEAKKHISRLRAEILDDKNKKRVQSLNSNNTNKG